MAPSQAALMVFEARLKNRGARPWLPDLNDTAMNQATYDVVHAKLLEEGYTDYADYELSWEGELRCTGDNPYPAIPEYTK